MCQDSFRHKITLWEILNWTGRSSEQKSPYAYFWLAKVTKERRISPDENDCFYIHPAIIDYRLSTYTVLNISEITNKLEVAKAIAGGVKQMKNITSRSYSIPRQMD